MREIIINDNNLSDDDISEVVTRVKGLMINSKGKILLAHNNNTYQFPGGHLEDDEDIDKCIVREIKEETGIDVSISEEPFLCIKTYDNNYFNSGRKVLSVIYYYRFFTDSLPNFKVFADLENFLKKNISDGMIDTSIGREMLYVVDVYHELFGGF